MIFFLLLLFSLGFPALLVAFKLQFEDGSTPYDRARSRERSKDRRRGGKGGNAAKSEKKKEATAAIDRNFFASLFFHARSKKINSSRQLQIPSPLDVGARGQVSVERLESLDGGERGEGDHSFFGEFEKKSEEKKKKRQGSIGGSKKVGEATGGEELRSSSPSLLLLLLPLLFFSKKEMEPLAVLREFASSGRLAQVSLQLSPQARTVRFGDQFEFAADAATRWRAKAGGGGANAPASTLPLGALAFFATSPTFFDKAPWGDYLKNARSAGFATVPVVDRKVRRRRRRRRGGKERDKEIEIGPISTLFNSPPPLQKNLRLHHFNRSLSPPSSWASTTAPTTWSRRRRPSRQLQLFSRRKGGRGSSKEETRR